MVTRVVMWIYEFALDRLLRTVNSKPLRYDSKRSRTFSSEDPDDHSDENYVGAEKSDMGRDLRKTETKMHKADATSGV